MTVTVWPARTPAVTAPWWPVQNTSDSVSSDGMSAESGATGSLTSVPWASGTRTASPWPASTPGAPHPPPWRQAICRPARAEVAGVVRPHERGDDQVAGSEAADLRSDLLDDADELVAHAAALLA